MDQIKQCFQRNIFQRCNESLKSLKQNLDHSFLHIQVLQKDISNSQIVPCESNNNNNNRNNKQELDNLQNSIKQINLMLKSVKIGVDQILKQCEESQKQLITQSQNNFVDPSKFINTSSTVVKQQNIQQQPQQDFNEQFLFNANQYMLLTDSLNGSKDEFGMEQNDEFFKNDKQDSILQNNIPFDFKNDLNNYPNLDTESESKQLIKIDEQFNFCRSKFDNDQFLKQDKKGQLKILKKANKIYKRGPYKHFSENEKNSAIEYAKKTRDISQTAKDLGIPLKNLKRWIQVGSKRKAGGGRKTLDPNMESQLYKWIIQEYQQTQTKISRKVVREKALRMTNFPLKFKASKGWLEKFLNRYECKKLLNYENAESDDLSISNQDYSAIRMKKEEDFANLEDNNMSNNDYEDEDDDEEDTYISDQSQQQQI